MTEHSKALRRQHANARLKNLKRWVLYAESEEQLEMVKKMLEGFEGDTFLERIISAAKGLKK